MLASADKELSIFDGCMLQDSVTKIQDVAATIERCDDVQRGLANFLLRAEENGGIEIALDGDAGTGQRAEFGKGNAPIDAEDVGAGLDDGGKLVVRGLGVINDGDGVAEAGNDFLDGGQNEFGVVAEIEFATPGVEELDRGDSGGNLAFEVEDGSLGDLVKKFAEDFGFAIEEIFYGGEAFFCAALDHVASEGPGGSGKAEDGDVRADVFDGAAKGFHEEAGFDFGVEDVEFFYILWGADRFREVWSLVFELKGKAHGFCGDKNVRENDDGVDAEAAERLNGDFDCQIGSFADL